MELTGMAPTAPPQPGWSRLLSGEGGPVVAYERSIGLLLAQRRTELYLSGADEDLAAIAAMRGPEATRAHFSLLGEAFGRAVRWLGPAPAQAGLAPAGLGLLCLDAVAAACGTKLSPADFDPAPWLEDLSLGELDAGFRATLALVALGAGKPEEARLLLGRAGLPFTSGRVPGADAQSLAEYLAAAVEQRAAEAAVRPAWDALVRAFPAAFCAGKMQWRQLVIAARVVYCVLGKTPPAEAAAALHGELLALAAEPPP
jgi:hypothetical protein